MTTITGTQPAFETREPYDDFLLVSPIVERHARIVFRFLRREEREEAVAEAIAAAFQAYVALRSRGRNPDGFPTMLATFAVLHVKEDRHVGGHMSSRDVHSRRARLRRGFNVERLPSSSRLLSQTVRVERGRDESWEAFLQDNARTPVPDQVAFRLDFPAFLQTLKPRDRLMIRALAEGTAAMAVADRYCVAPSRITQLRQDWRTRWFRFQDEDESEWS